MMKITPANEDERRRRERIRQPPSKTVCCFPQKDVLKQVLHEPETTSLL